jgi:predicted GIY-YIG superfamily endonuclease
MANEIPEENGIYYWYITKQGANQLGIDVVDCEIKDNKYLVYIGLAKNLNKRLNWHYNDKHLPSSIKSGYVSTLRQTLSALLVGEMVTSKEIVDKFFKEVMEVKYEVCKNYKEKELQLIASYNLPLNLKNNSHHPFYKTLKAARKHSKKKSLAILEQNNT